MLQILQSMFTIKTIFAIMLSLLSCYLFLIFHDPRFFLFLLSFIDNDYVGFNYV